MRLQHPTREYLPAAGSEQAYLLLHGFGDGIAAPYTKELARALADRGETVLALQFPYMESGVGHTSAELAEEIQALQTSASFLRAEGYARITIIAKSLGGIVASTWLNHRHDNKDVEVHIMGYVLGEDGVVTKALQGKLGIVVQGEHDRFGNAEAVRNELAANHVNGTIIEIAGADHSYRDPADPKDKAPAHQSQAIASLLRRLEIESGS